MIATEIKYYSGEEDVQILEKLFRYEDKEFTNKRASYETFPEKDHLRIEIKASDPTALRAVTNTITKILTVHSKCKAVINQENG